MNKTTQTLAFMALCVLGCTPKAFAQDKPNGKNAAVYEIPTANRPKLPIFPTTDKWETNDVGPLTVEKRTRQSPFDPLAQPKYKVGVMLKIPTSNVQVAPFFSPCNRPKNAPQEFNRCKQIGFGAKIDLNKKRENLNPKGKNGTFK